MTPQEFIDKAETGTLSDAELQAFLESISQKMADLKTNDPAAYLSTVTALSEAMDAASEALETAA